MGHQKVAGHLHRAASSGAVALTRRQEEILKLIAEGLTNREISETLQISSRTVEVHRFNLMRRLRVRNVAQLIRQAIQMGFLSKMLETSPSRR